MAKLIYEQHNNETQVKDRRDGQRPHGRVVSELPSNEPQQQNTNGPQLPPHPGLQDKAYFSGMENTHVNPVADQNTEAQKRAELTLTARPENAPKAAPSAAPRFTPNGG
jgi:hypothetical protein